MSSPKISVITVSFNQGEFIRQNIESVLQQDYPNFEHIVVDGGSTDSTVDILKSYPHLLWSSEPDNGQTDALNRGLERATGDIIAWLNSDDWYAPRIFSEIAEALSMRSVVLGECQMTDRDGNPTEHVPNVGREWSDILKYWVAYSSPAQPSVFFRRELLDKVRRSDGKFLDETLNYVMDFDLWLRIARHAPFTYQIPKVLSYYRMYESNKTGAEMAGVFREMSRVFRRYVKNSEEQEALVSFVVPQQSFDVAFGKTYESILLQSVRGYQIQVVDYGVDAKHSRQQHRALLDIAERQSDETLRYTRCGDVNLITALARAIECSGAPYVVLLEPGTELGSQCIKRILNLFDTDSLGLVFGWGDDEDLLKRSTRESDGGRVFSPLSMLSIASIPFPLVIRRAAYLDVGGFRRHSAPIFALRDLVLRLIQHSWGVSVESELGFANYSRSFKEDGEFVDVFGNYINGQVIFDLAQKLERDPFMQLKVRGELILDFPPSIVAGCRALLGLGPLNWFEIGDVTPFEFLQKVLGDHPKFAPAWWFLSKRYAEKGQVADAAAALEQFKTLHGEESRY